MRDDIEKCKLWLAIDNLQLQDGTITKAHTPYRAINHCSLHNLSWSPKIISFARDLLRILVCRYHTVQDTIGLFFDINNAPLRYDVHTIGPSLCSFTCLQATWGLLEGAKWSLRHGHEPWTLNLEQTKKIKTGKKNSTVVFFLDHWTKPVGRSLPKSWVLCIGVCILMMGERRTNPPLPRELNSQTIQLLRYMLKAMATSWLATPHIFILLISL